MSPAVAAPPPPTHTNPFARMRDDLRAERAAAVPFPPGDTWFSMKRTMGFTRDPLTLLLDAYARYGPVFTQRVFHQNIVFVLGPEANHHLLVSHAANYSWREGHYGDLMPLLGDGMLAIDGPFHRLSRKTMLPMFHRERIAESQRLMIEEVDAALDGWRDGQQIDLYHWTRELALRIAMRALFGLDPDHTRGQIDAAQEFENALSFWSKDYIFQIMRGPGSPWKRMVTASRRLDAVIYAELKRRRASGELGNDLISLMMETQDGDGLLLTDRNIRDEVMTLLFAGHDTTTSTVAFLFYELSRNPQLVESPDFDVALALEETLRMYPPAWIGPRRSIDTTEIAGVTVPGGVPVQYSSWVSHHLPDVWDDPFAFKPERFAPAARDALPKGAYVPFGGGSRTCIGMRFGQAEIHVIATKILERFRLDVEPGYRLRVRQMPTIGPRDGLPVTVRTAAPAAGLRSAAAEAAA
ncbi:MAG TPA: cytochrome P450 [Baekduia sp.]|uniref:cytochrome P450 n=1 Tax=Baekduia sp. TaxID=2600305 RepID=UPI002C430C1B|nr:cytochrome P450 [Baekduia sp.]HMJ35716.1 cytochrome P450 [Baekduia sp.]